MEILITIFYIFTIAIAIYGYAIFNKKLYEMMENYSRYMKDNPLVSNYYNFFSNISVLNFIFIIIILMINIKIISEYKHV